MFVSRTQPTVFSIIEDAGNSDTSIRQQALDRFCEAYTFPLVHFLEKRRKISADEALNAVQDFWAEQLLSEIGSGEFLPKYLRAKKAQPDLPFRQYLARSVDFFCISKHRSNTKHDQQRRLDNHMQGGQHADGGFDHLDIAYANQLLLRALKAVYEECAAKDEIRYWKIFEARNLIPAVRGTPRPGYEDLQVKLGFRSRKDARYAQTKIQRRFFSQFKQLVQELLPAEFGHDIEKITRDEMRQLSDVLSKSGGLFLFEAPEDKSFGYIVDLAAQLDPKLSEPNDSRIELFCEELDISERWQNALCLPMKEWLVHGRSQIAQLENCLADVLSSEEFDLVALDRVRTLAKQKGKRTRAGDEDVPNDFYVAVYLLAIVIAEQKFGERITSRSTTSLLRKVEQAMRFPWLDDQSQKTFLTFAESHATAK